MYDGVPNWPGYVPRQELAEFCRAHANELNKQCNEIWELMQAKGLSDEDYETLFSQHYSLIGQVISLRTVMEWCARHRKSEEELKEMESQNAAN